MSEKKKTNDILDNKKNVKEEPKQLGLDIKDPFKNKLYKAKREFDFAVLKLEVIKFLKDPLVWAVIVFGVILIAFQVNLIFHKFESLPSLIPLFKFYSFPKDILTRKEYIYSIPSLSTLIALSTLILVSQNYNKEKSLTKILLICALVSTFFLSIILVQIIKT